MPSKPWLDKELKSGLGFGLALGAAVLAAVLPWRHALIGSPTPGAISSSAVADRVAAATPSVLPVRPAPPVRQLDLAGVAVSKDAARLAAWIVSSADNGSHAFVIVDKRQAQVLVFEPGGRMQGASPVLLGYAAGDDSVAGIGKRPIEEVKPSERTTPAGRFLAEPGRNALGDEVLWVDYEAAVSMHRVRLTNPAEHRAERLATPSASDNRISYGCINVPVAFFETTLWPGLGHGGLVYVLPERKSLDQVFPGLSTAISRPPSPTAS